MTMWRPVLSPSGGDIDPEHEQELRLIAHTRAGAAWALSALVARYQPLVVRYLVRLTGDPQRSHKLAEGVFVRMSRRLRGPHGSDYLRLWLLRTSTDAGLDALRRQATHSAPGQLGAPASPVGLLAGKVGETSVGRLLNAWRARARTGPAQDSPSAHQFVWQDAGAVDAADGATEIGGATGEAEDLSLHEVIRHRLMRAVLAELPFADAQCLSLHLVAGLNQAEVAQALGITLPIAQRRIVQGLQLFGARYDAVLASLGIRSDAAPETPPTPGSAPTPTGAAAPVSEPVVDAIAIPVPEIEHLATPVDGGTTPPAAMAPEPASDLSPLPLAGMPLDVDTAAALVTPEPEPLDARPPAEEADLPLVAELLLPEADSPLDSRHPLAQTASDDVAAPVTEVVSPHAESPQVHAAVRTGGAAVPENISPSLSTLPSEQGEAYVPADEGSSTAALDVPFAIMRPEIAFGQAPGDRAAGEAVNASESRDGEDVIPEAAPSTLTANLTDNMAAMPSREEWTTLTIEPANGPNESRASQAEPTPEPTPSERAPEAPETMPEAAGTEEYAPRTEVPTMPRASVLLPPAQLLAEVAIAQPAEPDISRQLAEPYHADALLDTAIPVESERPPEIAPEPLEPVPAFDEHTEHADDVTIAHQGAAAVSETFWPHTPPALAPAPADQDVQPDTLAADMPLPPLAATNAEAEISDDEFTLVVEPEAHYVPPPRETTMAHSLRARRRRVLSADGEAEDPAETSGVWPPS